MPRRRVPARGLLSAEAALLPDVQPSKPSASRQNRTASRKGNFELRAVKDVQEVFQGIVDDELILGVLESCDYDAEKATQILCELTADKSAIQGGHSQSSGNQPSYSSPDSSAESYAGPCFWEILPQECKLQVPSSPHPMCIHA